MSDTVELSCGDARATVALRGAEPLSWTVEGGRQLLWHGEPEHWSYRAPILFPVVGASRDGAVRVDGRAYPMAQHGFARTSPFRVAERDDAWVRLRLTDDADSRSHYPFPFRLDVLVELSADSLSLGFEVGNPGAAPLPYGLGFHPAFPWPLDGAGRDGHGVVFAKPEASSVPEVAAGGLLARTTRPIPIEGRRLPLSPELFSEALVFLHARSSSFRFQAGSGAAIDMTTEGFPHLAVWSRPTAPFLSLECWTAFADWEDARGDLSTRDSMILLPAGDSARHRVRLNWQPAEG